MTEMESSPAVVLDAGSGLCKAGFAGDEDPSVVIPETLAQPRSREQPEAQEIRHRASFVGDQAQNNREILSIRYPIEHGIVTNWDDMEEIWDYIFHNKLVVTDGERAVLLTEAVLNPKANRERMTQIIFEKFNAPALHIGVQPLLSFVACGRTSGIVCESGDGVTQVLPVYEGQAVSSAIRRVDFGGRDLTCYLGRLLQQKGYSLTTSVEMEVVRDLKEKCGYVASDFDHEMVNSERREMTYALPDGTEIRLGPERFMCAESLFQPKLSGTNAPGIHQCVQDSIRTCGMDTMPDICCNILMVGGNTQFDGMTERMQHEIELLNRPSRLRFRTLSKPYWQHSAWLGGSILASLSRFPHICTSEKEYEEHGPCIMHRTSYFS